MDFLIEINEIYTFITFANVNEYWNAFNAMAFIAVLKKLLYYSVCYSALRAFSVDENELIKSKNING